MASTYVNDLRLNEMATGDQSGSWGTVTNTNLELIAEAFSFGTEGITTNADTHTTTIADGATDPGRSMFLKYTGTLDSACTITIAPNTVSKLWFIQNSTSGSQNIIISQGSGANVTIPAGQTKSVYSDGAGSGAAIVDAFATLNVVDLLVDDDLTVTDDMTVGGTLGVTGVLTATSLDISGDIDVDGTTNLDIVDIDGAVNMATTALVTGVLTTTAATVFNGGFASNANSTVGGTLTSTGVVTANAGVVVDNITIDGTTLALSSGSFLLDVASNIILDADGGQVVFKDGGTQIANTIANNGGDFTLYVETADKSLKFGGNDAGAPITALTLDMAAEGNAHFNRSIGVGFPALPTGAAFDSIRLGGAGFFMSNSNTSASGITAMVHNGQYDADNSWEYIVTDEAEYYYQSAGTHRFLSAPSGTAGDDITFVDRVEFEADGDVRIYDGNLVVANGHGIDFSAQTQSGATTGSEILDHYEEGTTNPTVNGGHFDMASGTVGSYTRVGNIVNFQAKLVFPSNSNGAEAQITLPFVVSTRTNYFPTGKNSGNGNTAASLSLAIGGASYIVFQNDSGGTTATLANLSSGNLNVQLTYCTTP